MPDMLTELPVASGRTVNDFTTSTNLGDIADPEFIREAQSFMDEVFIFLQDQKTRCYDAREQSSIQFNSRQDANERRSRLSLHQRTTEDGKLDVFYKDGHISAGVYQGWTCEAVNTASAVFYTMLFEMAKRPCVFEGRGNRPENKTLVEVLSAVTDDLLKRGDFTPKSGCISDLTPRDGTAVLRYEMGQTVDFERSSGINGEEYFKEANLRLTPKFQVWPLRDVLFTHPDRPEVDDQEGIFWLTRGVSVADLEKDAVIIMEETSRPVGKWRNLQKVYEDSAENHASNYSNTTNASAYPQYTLVEFEGRLPIFRWLKKGVLSWRVLKFFGVDVGVGAPNLEDPKTAQAWAMRLAQIPVWNVAYLTDSDGSIYGSRTDAGTPKTLLRFQPAPGRVPRRSAYIFVYVKDGFYLYGRSINDLGRQLEDAGDEFLNNDLRAISYNGDPTYLIDPMGLARGTADEVAKMLRDGKKCIEIRANKKVADVVQAIELPRVLDLQNTLAMLKTEFEGVTGVTAAVKGQAQAKTLGQDQINMTQSNNLFSRAVLRAAQVLAQLISDMIADILFYTSIPGDDEMDPSERYAEFVKYASRVSGLGASEIEDMLPTLDGLGNEVIIRHPAMPGADKSVLVQQLMQMYQITQGQGFAGPKEFVRGCLELGLYPRADDLIGGNKGMSPEDEQRQMAEGNYRPPDPDEDFVQHMTTHQACMDQLLQKEKSGIPLTESEVLLAHALARHINNTLQLMAQVQQLMQQQNMMSVPQGGGGMMPPGSKEGPSKPQGGTQPQGVQTEQEIASDIQGQANPQPQVPRPVPGGA